MPEGLITDAAQVVTPSLTPNQTPVKSVEVIPKNQGASALKERLAEARAAASSGALAIAGLDGETAAEDGIPAGAPPGRFSAPDAAAPKPDIALDPTKSAAEKIKELRLEGTQAGDPDAATATGQDEPYQDETGRWRNPDGSYAKAPDADAEAAKAPPATDDAQPASDAVTVVLPSFRDGEEPMELEIADPAVAERLAQLRNGAMRKQEYVQRLEAVEARQAQLKAVENKIRVAPEAFVVDTLAPNVQVDVALSLVAKHWEQLLPTLDEWAREPHQIKIRQAQNETKAARAQEAWRQADAQDRETRAIMRAIEAEIPDGASDAAARRFKLLAEAELVDRIQNRREVVTPQSVAQQLEDVKQSFNFGLSTAVPKAPAAPAARTPAAPAAKAAPAGKPSKTAERAKQAVKAAAIARRIAPGGVGGLPSEPLAMPKAPPGKSPLKHAFETLRANPGIARTTG